MKIANNIIELVGKTPMLKINKINEGENAVVVGKIESFNPTGSVKDRIAKAMIEDAEVKGLLKEGYTIIEPTSGNTGIGLAAFGAARGYRVILTMPETMSLERRNLLKLYGAELVLTEASKGMKGAIDKASELLQNIEKSYSPSQFENPSNPRAHFLQTGVEIWEDTDGKVDIFVAGVGTGGTISGVGEYLKSKNPKIEIIAVEPNDSPVLSGGNAGAHKIQGIGAGFIPKNLNTSIYDKVIRVTNDQAFEMGRRLAREEGIIAGISSGAAVYAAINLSQLPENKGKLIVVLLPDTGERYLSTQLFNY